MTALLARAPGAETSSARLRRTLGNRAGIRFFRFFTRDMGERMDYPESAGITVEVLPEGDVLEHCNDAGLDLRAEMVREAYARGDLCLGAFKSSELVGYCWLAFAPVPHLDGVWVRFAASVAWTYKSLVRPAYRGRGIAAALYVGGDIVCAERERRHSVICVESHNRPSVSAALRANYQPAGYGGYVRRGMPLLTWSTPMARRHGVAFFLPPAAAQG